MELRITPLPVLFLLVACSAAPPESSALRLTQTIDLPDVAGRTDHLALDAQGHRLFVAALGNDTVEVIDLESGKRVHQIKGLKEPQGVAYLPQFNQLIVTNGEGASASVFDGKSLELIKTIELAPDPDNLRYDPAAKRVFVGHGTGSSSAIGMIDPARGARLDDIKLAGHPESFQLESKGAHIYVNVPAFRHVAVIDREKAAVVATWTLDDAASNFPMALDETHHRLYVGCRRPATLIVLNTDTGKIVTALGCAGDADDVFYDPAVSRIYVSGGEGVISVIQQDDADHYRVAGQVTTVSGARTCFFDASTHTLYLAVPKRGSRSAAIHVYQGDAKP